MTILSVSSRMKPCKESFDYQSILSLLEKGEEAVRNELPLNTKVLKRMRQACIFLGDGPFFSYLKCFDSKKVRKVILPMLGKLILYYSIDCLEAYVTKEEMRQALPLSVARTKEAWMFPGLRGNYIDLFSKDEILKAFPVNRASFLWWKSHTNGATWFFHLIPRDHLDRAYPMSKKSLKEMMEFDCLSVYAPDKSLVLTFFPPTFETLREERLPPSYMDYIGWHHHLDTLFPRNQKDLDCLRGYGIHIPSRLEDRTVRHILVPRMNEAWERLRLSPDANEETVKAYWKLLEKAYALTED